MSGSPRPAERVASLKTSPIRELSENAPPGAIPLGLGLPGWAMAEPGWRALRGSGPCTYTAHAGLPELRDAIAARHGVGRDWVIVTTGAEGALTCLYNAWLDPGDRVLVPDPGFPAYPALARLVGAEAVPYRLAADRGYRLDVSALIARLDEVAPRVVVINVPSNPTGGAAPAADLRRLADACAERDVLLVSDEAYRELYLDRVPAGIFDVARSAVAVGSASKAWAASGLRIGWMVGPPERVTPARIVQGYAVIGAARPAQAAVLALMQEAEAVLAESRRQLESRWAALEEAFASHLPEHRLVRPDGGFYLWLELPEAARDDPFAFCIRLRDEAGVVLIPGLAFGEAGRNHVRLSFAAGPDQIAEGVRRLAPFWV